MLRVGSSSQVSQKLPSTSLVVESVIYVRDDDKEMIINWLTYETGNYKQLSIISIVGMSGVGNTTLAQHVYNDTRMEEADFVIKAWVCVYDDFDVLTLTRTILEVTSRKRSMAPLRELYSFVTVKDFAKAFQISSDFCTVKGSFVGLFPSTLDPQITNNPL
ncbi:putative disease resistance RPP13-like protein 1 [Glycine soja]|uniref:Putative disease resistance RPP13-like protein 1 n=1 Tax=Glycine soja TaxID=3848 RepID=A0A445KK69_GLYSO|nr:putative disease resistance RPP13-like protein 1 [Glycine soja]